MYKQQVCLLNWGYTINHIELEAENEKIEQTQAWTQIY